MNNYIQKNIDLVKSLKEEDVMEILFSPDNRYPLEENTMLYRDKITLKKLVIKFRPELINKYQLLIEEDDEKEFYD